MSQDYHLNLQYHDFETIDSYFRERIRRGLRRGYNYFHIQYHLHEQFGAVFHQYVQQLAQETQEEDSPMRNRMHFDKYHRSSTTNRRVVQSSDIMRFMILCDIHHKVSPNANP